MWTNFEFHVASDDADALEAYFEVKEGQSGTISMSPVNFYGLELKGNNVWRDWIDAYVADTEDEEQGGYQIIDNTQYHNFEVDN